MKINNIDNLKNLNDLCGLNKIDVTKITDDDMNDAMKNISKLLGGEDDPDIQKVCNKLVKGIVDELKSGGTDGGMKEIMDIASNVSKKFGNQINKSSMNKTSLALSNYLKTDSTEAINMNNIMNKMSEAGNANKNMDTINSWKSKKIKEGFTVDANTFVNESDSDIELSDESDSDDSTVSDMFGLPMKINDDSNNYGDNCGDDSDGSDYSDYSDYSKQEHYKIFTDKFKILLDLSKKNSKMKKKFKNEYTENSIGNINNENSKSESENDSDGSINLSEVSSDSDDERPKPIKISKHKKKLI